MDQRSDEWFEARRGKITASRVKDILPGSRGKYLAARETYKVELVCERLSNATPYAIETAAMRRGTDLEPEAISAYEFDTGLSVEPVGFVPHPGISDCGASPDGLVGDDGVIEVKCPDSMSNTKTHVTTLLTGEVPKEHIPQIQTVLAVTGRAWCDFISYDPRMVHPDLQFFCRRVERDDEMILAIEKEIVTFAEELDKTIEELLTRRNAA